MDDFHINFNIFGKYGYFESWQKAELSSPVKKRKREESSEEGEAKRCRFGELYFSAINTMNKQIVKSRVISGIMYRTASRRVCPVETYFPDNDRRSTHYALHVPQIPFKCNVYLLHFRGNSCTVLNIAFKIKPNL